MKHTPTYEIWILKTPGGEFICYEQPMNYDWNICSKKLYIPANLNPLRKSHDELLELCKMYLELSLKLDRFFEGYIQQEAPVIERLEKAIAKAELNSDLGCI